jgi:hypothetical protein
MVYNGALIAAILAVSEPKAAFSLLRTRRLYYLVDDETEPSPPDPPKHTGRGFAPAPPIWNLGIGSGGAGRQWRDGGYSAGLNIDLAAVVINDRCGALGTDHDRVADIGRDAASDWLETLALIDGQIAESGLHYSGPGRAGDEQRATNAPCRKQTVPFRHETPDAPQGIDAFRYCNTGRQCRNRAGRFRLMCAYLATPNKYLQTKQIDLAAGSDCRKTPAAGS